MYRMLSLFFLLGLQAASAQALEINTATTRQLEGLDGIGASLARRIVDDRRKHGAFRHWDDLQHRVRGISELKAWELSDQGLTVAGETHRRVFVAKVPYHAASQAAPPKPGARHKPPP